MDTMLPDARSPSRTHCCHEFISAALSVFPTAPFELISSPAHRPVSRPHPSLWIGIHLAFPGRSCFASSTSIAPAGNDRHLVSIGKKVLMKHLVVVAHPAEDSFTMGLMRTYAAELEKLGHSQRT